MRRIGFVLVIMLVITGAFPVWAEQPDRFKDFFDCLADGLIFEVQPTQSDLCQPVDYFKLVPGSLAAVDFQSLPVPIQDNIGEVSAEKMYVFQVKSLWTNEVRRLYAGAERGRLDGGMTAFDENRHYSPLGKTNPKPSAYAGDYIITDYRDPGRIPVEVLGYELDVERDDNRETTDVKGYVFLKNNANQTVAAVGGLINPFSKLNTPLSSDHMPFEIQDEIRLLPGEPYRVRINLKLPSATRKISPEITCVLYDDGSLRNASH